MEVLLTVWTLLVAMVTCRPTSQPEISERSHHRPRLQRLQYRSLRDAVIATSDLLIHSRHAFEALCKDKSHNLPTFDDELATCQGFAQFIGSFHREKLNLPVVNDIKLPSTRTFSTQLQHVLTQSVQIMTSFHYVIVNVTTLENRRLCQHEHGTDVCDIPCRGEMMSANPGYKFWCKCDKVARRVTDAQRTYMHALRTLRMPIPEPQSSPDVSILPPSRDSHVISYHFAALHSLNTQTDHIRNALTFVSNLARHEVL